MCLCVTVRVFFTPKKGEQQQQQKYKLVSETTGQGEEV